MSTRNVQRKLRTIIRSLKTSYGLQELLDSLDRQPDSISILINDEKLSEIEEDVLQFKKLVEGALTTLSKAKSRSSQCATIKEEFARMMSEQFEGIFGPPVGNNAEDRPEEEVPVLVLQPRKRGRPSNTNSAIKKSQLGGETEVGVDESAPLKLSKRRRSADEGQLDHVDVQITPMTTSQFTALKSIVNSLSKNELAEFFLYPVDRTVFPEYYEIIKRPTDLSTIKKKLNSRDYATVHEVLVDLRLVWENCKTFNADGSAICVSADILANLCEELVLEKLGQEFVIAKPKGRKALRYSDSSQASASESNKLKRLEVIPNIAVEPQAPTSSSKSSPRDLIKGETVPYVKKKYLLEIIEQFRQHHMIEPFLDPIDVDSIPGYSEIIERPMDLTTLEKNVRSGLYKNDVEAFKSDLRLIFENSMKFNEPSSELYNWAKIVMNYALEVLKLFPPSEKNKITLKSASADKSETNLTKKPQSKVEVVASALPPAVVKPEPSTSLPTVATSTSGYLKVSTDTNMVLPAVSKSTPVIGSTTIKEAATALAATSSTINVVTSSVPQVPKAKKISFERIFGVNNISLDAILGLLHDESNQPQGNSYLSTVEHLDNVIAEIENDVDFTSKHVLKRIEYLSAQRSEQFDIDILPYTTADKVFEVWSFGVICSEPEFFTQRHLYPKDYRCKTYLRLYVVPADPCEINNSDIYQFVNVEVTTSIAISGTKRDSHPLFELFIDGIGRLSTGESLLKTAWMSLMPIGHKVLKMLGNRLKRCRAVFNMLCCHPEVVPFLEPVPMTGAGGIDYYNTIKSPMWLREVHNRLVDGTYDNEFDFAWDVRLIFSNCMSYNAKNSDLYDSAESLMRFFDALLCHWVHNIQDKDVDNFAQGPWNEWQYLRYFDASPNLKDNFCRLTGTQASANELVLCCCCEDQYLPSLVGLETPLLGDDKSSWQCFRCRPLDLINNSEPEVTLLNQFADIPSEFRKEEFGGHSFVPNPEIGPGWCQARKKNRTGLKNLFLSPLGYEVGSKDIPAQKEFENVVNETLLKSRETEFNEQRGSMKKSRGKSRHKRQVTSQSPIKSNTQLDDEDDATRTRSAPSSSAATTEFDEEGIIVQGKLNTFEVPDGHRVVWCVAGAPFNVPEPAIEADMQLDDLNEYDIEMIGERYILSKANMPSTGLSGLDHPEIRQILEGFEAVKGCIGYLPGVAEEGKQVLLEELKDARARIEAMERATVKYQQILKKERWYWESERYLCKKDGVVVCLGAVPVKENFIELFPNEISNKDCETILCIWDFLEALHLNIGKDFSASSFTLADIKRCFFQPEGGIFASPGQSCFDELGCLLTEVLLSELKHITLPRPSASASIEQNVLTRSIVPHDQEASWQQFLQFKPLNVLTWPQIAIFSIQCHAFSYDTFTLSTRATYSSFETDLYNYATPFTDRRTKFFVATKTNHTMEFAHQCLNFMKFFPEAADSALGDALCLLYSHPYFPYLTDPIFKNETQMIELVDVAELFLALRSEFRNEEYLKSFESVDIYIKSMFDTMFKTINRVYSIAKSFTLFHHLASTLHSWICKLLIEWDIDIGLESLGEVAEVETGVDIDSFDRCAGASEFDLSQHALIGHLLHPAVGVKETFPIHSSVASYKNDFTRLLEPDYAKPHIFLTKLEGGTLPLRLKLFVSLQRTLKLLRSSEPDSWNLSTKLEVATALVDQCSRTLAVKMMTAARVELVQSANKRLHTVPDIQLKPPSELPTFEAAKFNSKASNVNCHYLTTSCKTVDSSVPWVFVPHSLLNPPAVPPSKDSLQTTNNSLVPAVPRSEFLEDNNTITEERKENHVRPYIGNPDSVDDGLDEADSSTHLHRPSRSVRKSAMSYAPPPRKSTRSDALARPVALEFVAQMVASARDVALKEHLAKQEILAKQLSYLNVVDPLPIQAKDALAEANRVYEFARPCLPLGYDIYGREYWLLGIQNYSLLGMFTMSTLAPHMRTDPAVLMKDKSGRWFQHNGKLLDALVKSFSPSIPCERILRDNLIERLFYARRKLNNGTFSMKSPQLDWMGKYFNSEQTVSNFKFPTDLISTDPQKYTWWLELMWSRCAEVRTFLYYGLLYRDAEESTGVINNRSARAEREAHARRVKKIRDFLVDDSLDLSVHGWMKHGPARRVLALLASTTAARLLVSTEPLATFQGLMRRTRFRSNMYQTPIPLQFKNLLNASKVSSATTASSQIQLPTQIASSPSLIQIKKPPQPTSVPLMKDNPTSVQAATTTSSPSTTNISVITSVNYSLKPEPQGSTTTKLGLQEATTKLGLQDATTTTIEFSDETSEAEEQTECKEEILQADIVVQAQLPKADRKTFDVHNETSLVESEVVMASCTEAVCDEVKEFDETDDVKLSTFPAATINDQDREGFVHLSQTGRSSPSKAMSSTHVKVVKAVEVVNPALVLATAIEPTPLQAFIRIPTPEVPASTRSPATASFHESMDLPAPEQATASAQTIQKTLGDVDSVVISQVTESTIEVEVPKPSPISYVSTVEVVESSTVVEEPSQTQAQIPSRVGPQQIFSSSTIETPPTTSTPTAADLQLSNRQVQLQQHIQQHHLAQQQPQSGVVIPAGTWTNRFIPQKKSKYVEMLHIVTGETLRIFQSQKDAAIFLGVSQAGISQCCTKQKPDSYGFKWRFYEGPPIDLAEIDHRQMKIEDIRKMQMSRGNLVPPRQSSELVSPHAAINKANPHQATSKSNAQTSTSAHTTPIVSPNQSPTPPSPLPQVVHKTQPSLVSFPSFTVAAPGQFQSSSISLMQRPTASSQTLLSGSTDANRPAVQLPPSTPDVIPQSSTIAPVRTKTLPNWVVTDIPQSAKLLKLKSELMSVFYAVPEKVVRWPRSEEERTVSGGDDLEDDYFDFDETIPVISAAKIETATASAAVGSEAKLATPGVTSTTSKAQRIEKRQLRRKYYIDYMHKQIRAAKTAADLLPLINLFGSSLPAFIRADSVPLSPKQSAKATIAYVAVRIFSLDRSIRYEELPGFHEVQSWDNLRHRPRQLVPRCASSNNCMREIAHDSRCICQDTGATRYLEISDLTPVTPPTQISIAMTQQQTSYTMQFNQLQKMAIAGRPMPLPTSVTGSISSGGTMPHSSNFQVRGPGGKFLPQQGQPVNVLRESFGTFAYDLTHKDPSVFDLENVQPYVPPLSDIVDTAWV